MNYHELFSSVLAKHPVEELKVLLVPPVVFSCGGPIDIKSVTPTSVRHWFHAHCASHCSHIFDCLIEAEGFKDYLSHYSNLQDFETAIAEIASQILIFVESPGSIAELGIFVSSSTARNKVTAIVDSEKTKDEDSFIFLGPLTSLRSHDSKSVLAYPFPGVGETAYDQLEAITCDIEERLNEAHKTESFNSENFGHFFFLVYELIRLAGPIRETELRSVLTKLNISPDRRLRRSLYLLRGLKLIDKRWYSETDWYYCNSKSQRIKFPASKKGEVFDTDAVMVALRTFSVCSESPIEKKRVNVLKLISRESS